MGPCGLRLRRAEKSGSKPAFLTVLWGVELYPFILLIDQLEMKPKASTKDSQEGGLAPALRLSGTKVLATFGILVLLTLGAFFMVNVEMPPWAHYLSGLNVILFAIPGFCAVTRWLGKRDAVVLFAVLGLLALVIETLAIITGFPYGHFGYSELLGYRLFGYTPWTVALAWTPLVLAAYSVAVRTVNSPIFRIVGVAVLLVVFDLVLDPGAVQLGFWRYQDGGDFYGVPLSNFLGWLFSGFFAAVAMEIFTRLIKPLLPAPAQLVSSGFLIIFFWTSIAFFSGMTAPFLIGIALLVGLAAFYVKYYYAFDDMIVIVDENNTPIASAPKLAAHNADTQRHRAFSVFLFNKKGELLLQQRALTKKTWPGVWSNSCCGHLMLHETVENAARRRLKYELGLKLAKLYLILPDFRYRAEKDGVVENEICPVMVGFTSSQPVQNSDEVNDVRWVDWERFVVEVADPANGYSPWAKEEVYVLEKNPRLTEFFARTTVG